MHIPPPGENPPTRENTEKVPWADSTMGKRWLAERGKPVLAGQETIDKKPWHSLPIWAIGLTTSQIESRKKEHAEKHAKGGHPSAAKKRKCTNDSHTVAVVNTDPPRITIACRITLPGNNIDTRFLLDSGALNGNYVSEETAALLRAAGVKEDPSEGKRVCVAIGDICRPSGSVFTFPVEFFNESTKAKETLQIKASVFPCEWPIMIGLPTIRTHSLIRKLMSHFEETPSPTHEGVTPTGAPVEPRVSVRDADDQIAPTTSTGSPRRDTAQNPCVLPWRPTVTSRFIPYATSHSCGCATGSAETSGLCQGCSEQVAAMTAAGRLPVGVCR
jgi:hypothetical protein